MNSKVLKSGFTDFLPDWNCVSYCAIMLHRESPTDQFSACVTVFLKSETMEVRK